MEDKDVMIEIQNEDLENLAKIYEPHANELPHVYSFIKTCIKAKRSEMEHFVTVMSPKDCWKIDGTFFALMPHDGYDIFVHSLDITGKNIVEGLLTTKTFNYSIRQERPYTMFFATHEYFFKTIGDVLRKQLHLEIMFQHTCTMLCLQKERALELNVNIPSDVYIREISPEEAYIVDTVWPNRYPGSVKKLKYLLRLNGGFGVYLKENDQLVSWILLSVLGQLAVLQTLEEHKRKGYASLVTKYMCRKIAEKEFNSFATVRVGNKPSELLFESLGFKKIGSCQYFGVRGL